MKRNPAANCGNCPYWASWIGTGSPDHIGECRQTSVKPNDTNQRWETTGANEWCGQHPDFWEAEAAKVSITYADGHTECVAVEQAEITNTCPSCWPASDDERAPEWTHVGAQSTTYCPHCGKATTSTFEQDKPRQ